ncbi:MAG: aminomethyl-transferring glycine dehydrogenase subunit GcvPA [Candidatus Bipolaricaulia bacterium]
MSAHPFIPNTDEDRREMLAALGINSVDALFENIPQPVRDNYEPLGLEPLSEPELIQEMATIAEGNLDPRDYISFLGGGVYDHFIPSVVGQIISRSEFSTAYTPYQPEASQGTLTWMFEYQTMVAELTGMEIANSSMYDGGSALAEAMLMAERIRGAGAVLVGASVHPLYRRVVDTYAWAAGIEIAEIPFDEAGRLDREFIARHGPQASGVLIQNPNFFGVVEDLLGLKKLLEDALLVVSAHPISLGMLKPPGAYGADIVVGEGQMLGNPLNYGGPLVGLFATQKAFMRQLPGRIAGRTVDADGKEGYVMALQTREQHIRRERATSNICTSQALVALAATVYLATLGKQGFQQLARLNLHKAHDLANRIEALDGFSLYFQAPFFNEFAVRCAVDVDEVLETLQVHGILGGLPLGRYYDTLEDGLLIAVTEKRTIEELDRFVAVLSEV